MTIFQRIIWIQSIYNYNHAKIMSIVMKAVAMTTPEMDQMKFFSGLTGH